MSSSSNPHKALQATLSRTLLNLHTQKVGFPALPRRSTLARVLSPQELELLEISRRHRELANEIRKLELNVEEALGGLDIGDEEDGEGDDEEEAKRRKELAEVKVRAGMVEAILDMVVSTRPVLEAVYGEGDKRLLSAINERDTLSTAHAHTSASITELQQKLLDTTTSRLTIDAQNTRIAARISQLWKKLEKAMPAEGTLGTEEERNTWKDNEWRVRVLRGVIGRVVVGSGIDWADDERWRELVLRCGEE